MPPSRRVFIGLLALAACSSPQKPAVHAPPPIETQPEQAETVACAQPGEPLWQDPPGYGELLRWIATKKPPLTLWHTVRVSLQRAPVSGVEAVEKARPHCLERVFADVRSALGHFGYRFL